MWPEEDIKVCTFYLSDISQRDITLYITGTILSMLSMRKKYLFGIFLNHKTTIFLYLYFFNIFSGRVKMFTKWSVKTELQFNCYKKKQKIFGSQII